MSIERRLNQPMEMHMLKSITVLAALACLGAAVAPAQAETVTVIVPYDDLDLTDPADSAVLDQRIEAAVEEVCSRTRPGLRDLKTTTDWEECKTKARAGAYEQLSILGAYENIALAV